MGRKVHVLQQDYFLLIAPHYLINLHDNFDSHIAKCSIPDALLTPTIYSFCWEARATIGGEEPDNLCTVVKPDTALDIWKIPIPFFFFSDIVAALLWSRMLTLHIGWSFTVLKFESYSNVYMSFCTLSVYLWALSIAYIHLLSSKDFEIQQEWYSPGDSVPAFLVGSLKLQISPSVHLLAFSFLGNFWGNIQEAKISGFINTVDLHDLISKYTYK